MFDVTVLTEMTAKIAGLDEHLYADDDLLAGVKAIETAVQSLQAAQGALLGELDARGTTDVVSGHRTANWLAHETGIAPRLRKPGCGWRWRCGWICPRPIGPYARAACVRIGRR
jgi:hypothetical protein